MSICQCVIKWTIKKYSKYYTNSVLIRFSKVKERCILFNNWLYKNKSTLCSIKVQVIVDLVSVRWNHPETPDMKMNMCHYVFRHEEVGYKTQESYCFNLTFFTLRENLALILYGYGYCGSLKEYKIHSQFHKQLK